MLSRLKLRTKLLMLLCLFAGGLLLNLGMDAWAMRTRMLADRLDKLQATVDMVSSYAATLERQVAEKRITREQELLALREVVHGLHFDGGMGYVVLQTLEGLELVHGGNPSLEGKISPSKDAEGRPISALIQDALRRGDTGTISYFIPISPALRRRMRCLWRAPMSMTSRRRSGSSSSVSWVVAWWC